MTQMHIKKQQEKNKLHASEKEIKVLRGKALKKVKEMKAIDLSTIDSVNSSRWSSRPATQENKQKNFCFNKK